MTCLENAIGMKIYSNGHCIGSALLGCQDGLLSHHFGMTITSELLPGCVLECMTPDGEGFFLSIEFED